jgi:Bifunctional DNA primase/polymerase, N-terminal
MPNDVLAAAIEYAAKNVPIFPVNPRTKKPLIVGWPGEASTDQKQIEAWWRQWPTAMIGIPCGERTGVWIIDPDINKKKGLDGLAELAKLIAANSPLPATRICITPRGGRHYHWRFTGRAKLIRNSTSKIARGIDVRGAGGFAIVPPSFSIKQGAAYQWENGEAVADAPDWLVDAAVRATKSRASAQAWALSALIDECDKVANAREGERNDMLNRASFNLGQIIGSGGLNESEVRDRLFKAAEQCGLVKDDGEQQARATIDSGLKAGHAQPRTNQTRQQQQLTLQPPPLQPGQQQGSQQGSQQGPQPAPQPYIPPTIRLTEGELPRVVDEAEEALIAAKQPIFQHGTMLVRPIKAKLKAANDRYTHGWQLLSLAEPHLIDTFTRIARFEKMDLRAGAYVRKNCPDKVAEVYLSRTGRWRVPSLLGIVNTPFLRPDGSLCERPGYDSASKLLFHPDGYTFSPIAAAPTLEQAREALAYLDDTLLEEFPFVERIDRAVALSLILTAIDRRAMATAPLHGFTSPVAGTGKSLLNDIASVLATGDRAPVISMGRSEEEFEKRLGAALIAGDLIVSIDNCDRELSSAFLCQALTQQRLKIRQLGLSRHVDVPMTSLFVCTGNNLAIADDLTRRTLLCRLDAGMERPELRSFKRDVLETARSERGKLVVAALTVLRGWHAARTVIGIDPLGSFEDWSFRIRQPLLWLDQVDPCESIATVRDSDPNRSLLIAVLKEWKRCLGVKTAYTVQIVINRAMVDQDFYGAIAAVAADRQGGLSNMRLGRWLSKNNGKIIGKLRLSNTASTAGYPLWQVIEV